MKDVKAILFVCTGNSCRSIMAEAYLKKRLAEEDMPIEVRSAGTLGIDGMTPTKETVMVLEKEEIDAAVYESKELTEELVDWADLVLVMEPSHKNRVIEMVRGSENKILYLGQFDADGGDIVIPDPIGRQLAFYRASFGKIKRSIEGLIEWLKE